MRIQFPLIEESTFQSNLVRAFDDEGISCYAIIDIAQDRALLQKFEKHYIAVHSKCLLPAALDSNMEEYAPHLVELSPLAADADAWLDTLRGGTKHLANFTLLASWLSFDNLWNHLVAFS